MYLPSGEKVANSSLNFVLTTGTGFLSPSIGNAKMPHPYSSPARLVNRMNRPSRDQSDTYFSSAETSSGSASRVPDASLGARSPGPWAGEVKTMRRPSGDHKGSSSSGGSKVKRDDTPRVRSRIHKSHFPPLTAGA